MNVLGRLWRRLFPVRIVFEYVRSNETGLIIKRLDGCFPSVENRTGKIVRITWRTPGTNELRSVLIQDREIHAFHGRCPGLLADHIEVLP